MQNLPYSAMPRTYDLHQSIRTRSPPVLQQPRNAGPSTQSNKKRLKWTPELDMRFVYAMVQLGGGPRKATPKGSLRLMAIEELTIFHIRSHLQKCGMTYDTSGLEMSRRGSAESVAREDTVQSQSAASNSQPLLL